MENIFSSLPRFRSHSGDSCNSKMKIKVGIETNKGKSKARKKFQIFAQSETTLIFNRLFDK